MSLVLSWRGKAVPASLKNEGQLAYDCPFCGNGVELKSQYFKIHDRSLSTRIPIECPWEKCGVYFEIAHGFFVLSDSDGSNEIKTYQADCITHLWRSKHDKRRANH